LKKVWRSKRSHTFFVLSLASELLFSWNVIFDDTPFYAFFVKRETSVRGLAYCNCGTCLERRLARSQTFYR
jgi:hypothetical protein